MTIFLNKNSAFIDVGAKWQFLTAMREHVGFDMLSWTCTGWHCLSVFVI